MSRNLSFTTMATPGRLLPDILELARANDFAGVDIRCSADRGEVHPEMPEAELLAVASQFRSAGLAIPSLLCYPARAKTLESLAALEHEVRALLLTGQALGAQSVRIFGPRCPPEIDATAWNDRLVSVFSDICRDESSRIPILIQNHKGHLGAEDIVRLAERVSHRQFGLIFSPDHEDVDDPDVLLNRVQPWTRELYIADLLGKQHALPGQGALPLARIVRFFDRHGFRGFYSFKWEKIWAPAIEDAEIALPHYVKFMQAII